MAQNCKGFCPADREPCVYQRSNLEVRSVATITKRKVKGHVYYYLVEGKRVNGKSRLVKQQYLGRAEQVVARLEGQPPEPTRVRVAEYGASQALLAVAVAHLLRREAARNGIDLSLPQLLQDLTEVQEVLLAYPETSGTRDRLTLTTSTRRQQKLLNLFGVPDPMAKPVI